MRDVAELLNAMMADGVVSNYALFGAAAQIRYTEPVATLDAHVLVAVRSPEQVDALADVYRYCRERGLAERHGLGERWTRFERRFLDE